VCVCVCVCVCVLSKPIAYIFLKTHVIHSMYGRTVLVCINKSKNLDKNHNFAEMAFLFS